MLRQSQIVGKDLRKKSFRARTITLKIKHADFRQFTRSMTIDTPTQSSETIYKAAIKLLERYQLKHEVRLIGVGASGFISAGIPVQMELFESEIVPRRNNWEKMDKTLDSISKKFGYKAVQRATLTDISATESKKQ